MKLYSVILAGGKSSRMGTNKSFLKINDTPVLEHVRDELNKLTNNQIIIANDKTPYEYLRLPVYSDRYLEKGPLAGIESALHHIKADLFLFAACDMPFIQATVYEYLLNQIEGYEAVVPVFKNRIHPLVAIYNRSVLRAVQQQLEKNQLKVTSFFEHINVNYVESYEGISEQTLQQHFFNMNNPTQYQEAINTYRLFNK